ncbi:MAG TPA: ROK family protein [Solirubrobacteraceae bacterium]|nr:ROK family protein [Solirubrobacteraceae bacterium]
MSFGGIEAGGTKWVCGVGDGGATVLRLETIPTTTPQETIARAAEFFNRDGILDGIGVGSFGPIDVHRASPTWGQITTTPKPGWAHTNLVASIHAALEIPVAFDTDVNAAALAESRWGAALGLETFSYITVGTGIGGGAIVNGRLLHGLLHPELGHMRVPHDRARDPFDGVCPYHGDCLEGLASGEAIRQRWGRPGEELSGDAAVWALESEYLALGLTNIVCTLSPQRIILGGGVTKQPVLLPLVRLRLQELLAGYFDAPELSSPEGLGDYVVAPGLGDRAGVLGAIELARLAAQVPTVEQLT